MILDARDINTLYSNKGCKASFYAGLIKIIPEQNHEVLMGDLG